MPTFSIEAKKTVTESRDIELTFPLYLKYEGKYNADRCEDWINITKVEQNGSKFKTLELRKHKYYGCPAEYQIEKLEHVQIQKLTEYFTANSYSDYSYTNDPSEYNELFNEIVETLGVGT